MTSNNGTQDQPDASIVRWEQIDTTLPMTSTNIRLPSEGMSLAGDLEVLSLAEAYTDSKIPKIFVNGVQKLSRRLSWTDSTTVSGGNATFYITSDRTSTGTAMATALDIDTANFRTEDGTGQYAFGTVSSPNVKTLVLAIFKQVFNGITVVGIAVLGSVTNTAAPNGTVVKLTNLDGDAA